MKAPNTIFSICTQNDPGESYHVVNNQETPHELYIREISRTCNIKNLEFSIDKPTEISKLEKNYYKTVGNIFTPYIISKPMDFQTMNILGLSGICTITSKNRFIQIPMEKPLRKSMLYRLGISLWVLMT